MIIPILRIDQISSVPVPATSVERSHEISGRLALNSSLKCRTAEIVHEVYTISDIDYVFGYIASVDFIYLWDFWELFKKFYLIKVIKSYYFSRRIF